MRQRIQMHQKASKKRRTDEQKAENQNSIEGHIVGHATKVHGDRNELRRMQEREIASWRIHRGEMHAIVNVLNAGRSSESSG